MAIVMGNGLSYFTELFPNSPGMSTAIYYNGSITGRLVGNLGGGMVAQFVGLRDVYWVCMEIAIISFFILRSKRPNKAIQVISDN